MSRHPLPWLAVAWLLYVLTWPLGHGPPFNDVYTMFAFGPLLMGAWLLGWRGAVGSVLLFLPLQILLFLTSDHRLGWDAVAGEAGAVGLGLMSLITLGVGWAADSNRRMRELALSRAELVAVVSHEVRTPLTGVVGLAEELRQGWPALSDSLKLELVDLISQSAQEMAAIVDDLLTAARAQQGNLTVEPAVTNLREVATSVVEQLRLAVPIEGEAVAWADPGRVRQVVRNLVVNAARYGGSKVTVRACSNGSRVWLDVSDDGDGVTDGQMSRLFDPSTPDPRHSGSQGLGLALSKKLALLMEGDLTYQRVADESVFRLSLPKAVMPTSAPSQVSSGR